MTMENDAMQRVRERQETIKNTEKVISNKNKEEKTTKNLNKIY